MKTSSIIFCVALALALWSCKPGQDHTHEDHQAHAHEDANAFMNEGSFEGLVDRFEDPERLEWQKPDSVVAFLGELSGKTVADIGAGSGYFAFRLAPKAKKVIAIDIDERFLAHMEEKKLSLPDSIAMRVECRLADEDDPKLKAGEADLVLIVDTYHHIGERETYFRQLREGLAEGGQLVVVDFFKRKIPVGPPPKHKLSYQTVSSELQSAGYTEISVDTTLLPYQYILIAR